MLAFTLRKPAWSKIILEKFTMRSGPVTEGLRPSPLCAWAQWLSLGSLVDRALGDELHEACVAMALKLSVLRNDTHAGRTLDPTARSEPIRCGKEYIALRCRLKAAVPCGKKLWICSLNLNTQGIRGRDTICKGV